MSFEYFSFWRGVGKEYNPSAPAIHQTRMDRRPRDSGLKFHLAADDWFKRRFGVAFRSQALHVTSKPLTARAYAATEKHVMRIVPLSEYRYCWSPNVSDLLFGAQRLANASQQEVDNYLESMGYRMDGLGDAFGSGNEVMLHCVRYVAIPRHLLVGSEPDERGGILIVGG
jgi:hypothetical protein